MPTVKFDAAIKKMVENKPEIGTQMLEDAINAFLSSDLNEARVLLRQYVNATLGFKELARLTGKQDKNLMRALSTNGNPTMATFVEILGALQKASGVTLTAHAA